MTREDALPFINRQVFLVSDFIYEELKKIQFKNPGISYRSLIFSTIYFIRDGHNICMSTSDIEKLEEGIGIVCRRVENDEFKEYGSCRGLLDSENTMFLDRVDKGLRVILEKSIITK